MASVAVVGLGTMGAPMARNLVRAGHDVVGCDVDPGRADAVGVRAAATPARAAAGAEFVLLSLPSPGIVAEVARAVGAAAAADTAVVDMSTSSPTLARELAVELEPRGLDVLDAPVSGGPRGAEDASLTIMVGGRAEAFERVAPLLRSLGRNVVHVGGHGAGQAAKLCNNLIVGVTMAAISEACAIAVREQLDASTLYDLLSTSTGDSRVLRTRFALPGVDERHPASRGYDPLFMLDLLAKDLGLALEVAAEHGVETPVATAALAEYRQAQKQGLGKLDYSAVFLGRRG